MPIDNNRLTAALADRYAIEREIGRGGMATVYLAEDLKHGRQVAVKVLEPELASSLGSARFLREIETAARLNHPHILPLYDSGEADGFLYYAMPYMESSSLRDRLNQEGQLPLENAVRIAREVAGGLDYAHEQGVVHRDIKPGNIMLSRDHAVIADFGIARAVSEAGGETVTKTGISLGSPTYMSPEQASGSETLDGRSDIYALGCVLYEMLAGEPPYTGKSAAAIVARKSLDAAPSLRAMRETVPPGVEQAVERALAKVPADRFSTAAEFATALKSGEGKVTGDTRRPTGGRRIAGVAIMVVVLAAVAIGWWLTRERGAAGDVAIQSVAVLPFADMSPAGDQEYLGEGIAEVLLNALNKIPDLRVAGRSSSFQFDERNPNVREVGRVLDVEAVIEGSVRADEDTLRFSVQLVNASDGFQLWSESYTREAENIFAAQEEIAREIVAALGVQLTGDTTMLVEAQETDREAYDLYLKGQYFLNKGFNREAQLRAVGLFQDAITQDPSYAPAYAGLANSYLTMQTLVTGAEVEEIVASARRAAARALELDEGLSEAHVARARILVSERYYSEAEHEYQRALELSPGNPIAYSHYGDLMTVMGRREESISKAHHAVALDPLSISARRFLLAALAFAERWEEALQEAETILELDPDYHEATYWRGGAYSMLGRHEEAIATFQQLVALDATDIYYTAGLASAYALSGDRESALRAIDAGREIGVPYKEIALIYGGLGDLDSAFAYLDKAREEQPGTLWWIDTDPWSVPLRADARWEAFMQTIDPAR